MKLNGKTDKDYFIPAVIVSILLHGVLLISSGKISRAADFSVEVGPNSFEVVSIELPDVDTVGDSQRIKSAPGKDESDLKTLTRSISENPQETSYTTQIKHQKRPMALASNPSISMALKEGSIRQAEPNTYRKNPAPVYPQQARKKGWEGVVILKVFVVKDGKPDQVMVEASSGYPVLDDAASKTVKAWDFIAARKGAATLKSWVRIPIRFELNNKI